MVGQKGYVVEARFSLTEMGQNVLPAVEQLERRVGSALRAYKARMTALADKYGIPEDDRKGFMAAMLNPWAAQLFGFSDEIYRGMRSQEQAYEDAQRRLQRIQQRMREFLQ